MIAVTEPSMTGGVGAMGAALLAAALQRAGHEHQVVHWERRKTALANAQVGMFETAMSPTDDTSRFAAWFVSSIYPRQWWDIPAMMRAIGVPARWRDRRPSDPLIAFGGQSMLAPAPIEEFADVVALGDGEVTGVRLAELVARGMGRLGVMAAVAGERGFLVPAVGGELVRVEAALPSNAAVPGRAMIEAARGCKSKCAFCPIGWAGGTYREASRDAVTAGLAQLRGRQVNVFAPDYSSISWVTELDQEVEAMGCSNSSRDARLDVTLRVSSAPKSYSFGIEGISERIRAAIGKPMSTPAMVDGLRGVIERGTKQVRLYTILGFPGESDSDLAEWLSALDQIRGLLRGNTVRLDITQTLLQAVPHTPLQGIPNHFDESAWRRCHAVRAHLRAAHERDGVRAIASEPKGRNLHEQDAWLQRAGRDAWQIIAHVDSRRAWLDDDRWRRAAAQLGLDVDADLSGGEMIQRNWAHVSVGSPVDPRKMLRVYERHMGSLT